MFEAEHLEDVHTAVHARHDCKMQQRGERQPNIAELRDKSRIIQQKFRGARGKVIGVRHGYILPEQVAFLVYEHPRFSCQPRRA